MKETKFFSGIVDFATAYFVGHCSLLGTAPFGTALLGAGSICGRNIWMMFTGLMCTLLERKAFLQAGSLLYPCIWIIVMLTVRGRRLQLLYPRTFLLSFLSGLMAGALQVAAAFFLSHTIGIWQGCAEGVLVFSFMLAFSFAYKQLRGVGTQISADTQTQLACLIFATTVFAGMPVQMFGQIEVFQTACIFSMFYVSYRFGFTTGIAWTAIAGVVYALRLGEMKILAAWVFVVVIADSVAEFFHAGRYASLLVFSAVYWGIGHQWFPELLSEAGSKAFVSAVFLLVLTPAGIFTPDGKGQNGEVAQGTEWGRLTLERVRRFSAALRRIDYTFAGTDGQRIGFSEISAMLDDFAGELDCCVPLRRDMETMILAELGRVGIKVRSLTLLKEKNGSYRLYADVCVVRGRLIGAETVRQIVSTQMGMPFEIGEESRQLVGRNYDLIILEQKPAFSIRTAARRLACMEEVVSGDNFYIGNLRNGKTLVMIADGMGNGPQAAADSEQLLASVEELVDTGFDQEMAVRLVNAYLSEQNKGERFTTLDMLLFDRYTGVGQLLKYGAATTYVKRGNWMECIKSTSLPVGVMTDAGCECSLKKYYKDDLLVMVSDGVLDSILFENKDDYMNTLLGKMGEEEPDEIADTIVGEIRKVCGKRLKDDATLVVCRVMKNS